jgi:hypothetical protein
MDWFTHLLSLEGWALEGWALEGWVSTPVGIFRAGRLLIPTNLYLGYPISHGIVQELRII